MSDRRIVEIVDRIMGENPTLDPGSVDAGVVAGLAEAEILMREQFVATVAGAA